MELKEAVLSLDPKNDEHWNKDGLPDLVTLRDLTGDDSVIRDMVEEAAPGYNREAAKAATTDTTTDTTGSDEDIEVSLEEKLKTETEKLNEIRVRHSEVTRELNAQIKVVDKIISEREEESKPGSSMEAVHGYLAHQRKILADRQGISGPSQLDKSMARQTGFGQSRPK